MDIKAAKLLAIFLWLVALHSFLVGLGLILLPSSVFDYLGFNATFDRFFSTQGGVFHIVMAVGYTMPCINLNKFKSLVTFAIVVKFIAAIFLVLYFCLVRTQLLIILSAVSDFIMGATILILFRSAQKSFGVNE